MKIPHSKIENIHFLFSRTSYKMELKETNINRGVYEFI